MTCIIRTLSVCLCITSLAGCDATKKKPATTAPTRAVGGARDPVSKDIVKKKEKKETRSAPDVDEKKKEAAFPVPSPAEKAKSPSKEPGPTKTAGITLAKGVEKRAPVAPGTRFAQGDFERLYAFMKVSNPAGEASEVTVGWTPEGGKERGTVTVAIGAEKRWRTWAFTKVVKEPGKWSVVVRDKEGAVIGEAPFEIE
jgi:hypothetical protein